MAVLFAGLLLFLQGMTGYIYAQDATVTFSLDEQLPPKTILGSVALESHLFTEISNEKFQKLQFQILSNTGNKYAQLFTIERNTSILWTKVELDRESFDDCGLECVLDLNVAVYDLENIENPKLIQVLIDLIDVNDNKPSFQTENITLGIDEASEVGSEILVSAAEDFDKGKDNSVQTYTLSPATDTFAIEITEVADYKEFIITLKNSLDRETVSFHEFTVLAIDGGNPKLTGTLTVYVHVLDTNDNYPVFAQNSYSSTIEENAAINSTVALVYAKDLDSGDNGKVSYRFKDRAADKVKKLFHINDSTGEITVAGVIDYEQYQEINFTIQAYDHGTPPKVADVELHVKILDQNDNSPEININYPPGGFLLSESVTVNTFVAHMSVSDMDTGDFGSVSCQILDEHFTLESVGIKDNYKIVVNKALDHETHTSHIVNVTCMDGGTPPKQNSTKFVVHVDDQNDNKPIFTQSIYKASIEENNRIGAFILGVAATDLDSGRNGQVKYEIHPEVDHLFIINAFTGIITANDSLDRETHGTEFIFRVLATDQGDPSLTTTGSVVLKILDQNDNDPVFESDPIKFHILENLPKGTPVGNFSVSDPDNGDNGTIVLSFPKDPIILENFSFEQIGNTLATITQEKELDRDVKAFHEFTVRAMDLGGRTSSAVIIVYLIDENDNKPVIVYPRAPDNQRFVPYSLAKDSLVFTVDARDPDIGRNSELYYSIDQDNSTFSFYIHNHTGQVFINNTLKKEDIGSIYSLVIRVRDWGSPPLSSWSNISLHIVEGNVEPVTNVAQTNLWIVLIVVLVTVILSAIMLIVIVKLCFFNRNKYSSDSSGIIIESGKVDTKLIDSSSSSSSSSKGSNTIEKSLGSSLKGQVDENGSLHNTTLSSLDRQIDEQLYLQGVRDLGYDITRKADETNSDNSGEMGTRDSGQGGSDVDINSLSELPVLEIPDVTSDETVPPPCYHGNLAPSDFSHKLVLSPDNLMQSLKDSQNSSTSDSLFAPKLTTNFPTFKTAERKELSKVRRVPKRVMFSDDLENSQSSGRSSTMSSSFSDINHVTTLSYPSRVQRPNSIDLENNILKHTKDLRHSADNLSCHSNSLLPGYRDFIAKNNTREQTQFLNSDNRLSSFNRGRSYPPEFTKSLSSPDESTTTSGSYSLTLDEMSSNLGDDVFAKDLFV